jgi:hypothetical protein
LQSGVNNTNSTNSTGTNQTEVVSFFKTTAKKIGPIGIGAAIGGGIVLLLCLFGCGFKCYKQGKKSEPFSMEELTKPDQLPPSWVAMKKAELEQKEGKSHDKEGGGQSHAGKGVHGKVQKEANENLHKRLNGNFEVSTEEYDEDSSSRSAANPNSSKGSFNDGYDDSGTPKEYSDDYS